MDNYIRFILDIHRQPRHFQSDFARFHAGFIAEAASRGHISSIINGISMGKWFITSQGLFFLNESGVEV